MQTKLKLKVSVGEAENNIEGIMETKKSNSNIGLALRAVMCSTQGLQPAAVLSLVSLYPEEGTEILHVSGIWAQHLDPGALALVHNHTDTLLGAYSSRFLLI